MPVWLARLPDSEVVRTLTLVGGKEQAIKEQRKMTWNSLYQVLVGHRLKNKSGMGNLRIIKIGIIQEWGMGRKALLAGRCGTVYLERGLW